MIICRFFLKKNSVYQFEVEGHAFKNPDLCIAVSTITQLIILGFLDLLKIQVEFIKKQGFISCSIIDSKDNALIFDSYMLLMMRGFEDLEKQFPNELKIEQIKSLEK